MEGQWLIARFLASGGGRMLPLSSLADLGFYAENGATPPGPKPSATLQFQRGDWHEWKGTYTIIKPHSGAIFQSKNSDNGHDYEASLNGKKVNQGQYDRPEGHTDFRWGMYVGGKTLVKHDAMIFVTGVRFE